MHRASRREFLRSAGAGVIGLLAASCAPAAQPSSPATPVPATPPIAAPPTAAPAPTAAPTAPPVTPRATTKVRITDIQITSAAGSYVADARGYFREEGIEAEFLTMAGADQVPAVVSGTADVAGTAITAALFNALARGLPIKLVADHGANLPGASAGGWAVRKDLVDSGRYNGPADVRGWKVASGTPGSAADIALDRFLRQGGLTIDDIELVVMAYPDVIPAFANKALDGVYFQEPFTTIAVNQGLAVRGPIGYDIYPNQQIGVVAFGQRLTGDRDLALRYLRAYVRGVRDYVKGFIQRDQATFDQLVPILIEHTTVKERALFEQAIPSGLKADPVPNVQSMKDDQEWYVARGLVQQRVDVDSIVDLSLVEEAIRQLGPARA